MGSFVRSVCHSFILFVSRGGSRGGTGGTAPTAPSNLANIILHRHVLFYKFTDIAVGNVPFNRLALLGPAAIVDHFAGSRVRRLRFVF